MKVRLINRYTSYKIPSGAIVPRGKIFEVSEEEGTILCAQHPFLKMADGLVANFVPVVPKKDVPLEDVEKKVTDDAVKETTVSDSKSVLKDALKRARKKQESTVGASTEKTPAVA